MANSKISILFFIDNCKAQFIKKLVYLIKQVTEEGELIPEQRKSIQKTCQTHILVGKFLNVDSKLKTGGTVTDEETVSSINVEISDEEIENVTR